MKRFLILAALLALAACKDEPPPVFPKTPRDLVKAHAENGFSAIGGPDLLLLYHVDNNNDVSVKGVEIICSALFNGWPVGEERKVLPETIEPHGKISGRMVVRYTRSVPPGGEKTIICSVENVVVVDDAPANTTRPQ